MITRQIKILFITLLISGCSSIKQPLAEKIAYAELMLHKAQDSEAPALAPNEFQQALQHFQQAKEAFQHQDFQLAINLAEKASMDAKLAEAKAEARKVQLFNNPSSESTTN